ncbi:MULTISPECIES: ATP-binding protein [Nonomuraea]|uniref:Sensor-like histidine kinase SenX3 n=1 Tax=Nonomuraea mangrovi TaxID=2316207 RepID=A0ABW4T6P3_9ACTN
MGRWVDYEVVFKTCPAPLLILTPDFVMVAANDAYLKVAKRTLQDVLGRYLFTVFPPNPHMPNDPETQGVEVLRASLEHAMATGQPDCMPMQRYDVEVVGRPGMFEERYWNTVNTPILGVGGAVEWIMLSIEDVTDFVRAMRRTPRAAHGKLAQRQGVDVDLYSSARELHILSEQLKQAQSQHREITSTLQEAIRRQRQLVFDVSHDLRNPITGLLTELEVALSEPAIDLQQILRNLLRDAERLNEIVADVLDLARVDSVPPGTELVDMGRLVAEELQRRIPAAGIHTRLDQGVVVRASRIRLARLLGNLLANAERHTSTTIEIIVTTRPSEAVLEVIDDGPGIPRADRERVFERLYRLEDARSRDPGGSGLGLPIARGIAQAYGGRLYAADHPAGARLVLRLPLYRPVHQAAT